MVGAVQVLTRALGVAGAHCLAGRPRDARRRARRARRSTCPSRRRASRPRRRPRSRRRGRRRRRSAGGRRRARRTESRRRDGRRCIARSPSRTTPSASASAGSPPRKAAATTCSPASSAATCWVSEVATLRPSRQAAQARKPLRISSSSRSRPMNTTFDSRFSPGLPVALRLAVEHHMHALEHEALGLALQRDDALAAQDLRALRPGSDC